MSTSPESSAAEDRLVTVLSRWLARHLDDAELRRTVEEAGTHGLSAGQAGAVRELLDELEGGDSRGELEMVVRETLEALALDT
jgi:hypothetical protein